MARRAAQRTSIQWPRYVTASLRAISKIVGADASPSLIVSVNVHRDAERIVHLHVGAIAVVTLNARFIAGAKGTHGDGQLAFSKIISLASGEGRQRGAAFVEEIIAYRKIAGVANVS